MENPEIYLPTGKKRVKVPAPRIFVMGPRGSGKSTQSRTLAIKLDVFHVKFRDYLQELIIGKTKKYVEPERDEDKDGDEEVDDEDEAKLVLNFFLF
jgi:adenylate kinase family enzyme